MPLSIDRTIDKIKSIPSIGALLADGLQRMQDALNGLATNVGADANGTVPAPPAIQKLNVKTDGFGTVHATIEDNNPIQRGVSYFIEYDTDPSFKQPHVQHLGTSRSTVPFLLPESDDDGNQQQWYFRAYSQYPGGHPGTPILFGGLQPTPVNPGGGIQLTLLPSTGSGTAQPDGQAGGSGFGKVLFRGPQTAKRQS